MTERVEIALALAKKGMLLIPQDRRKKPYIKDWPNMATDDPLQIQAWERRWPKLNYAALMGAESGMIGLDIDVKNDQPGKDSYQRLIDKYGKIETFTTRTPSGGGHVYFRWPDCGRLKNKILPGYPGIECKVYNALLTIPGSAYASGAEYKVARNGEIADAPDWLKTLIKSENKTSAEIKVDRNGKIPEGQRHAYLLSLAGKLRSQGMEQDELRIVLLAERPRCEGTVPDSEIEELVKWTAEKPREFHPSDVGNAERLIHRSGEDLLYCDLQAVWYCWDGRRWKRDDQRRVTELSKDLIKSLYLEAAAIDDDKERKGLARYALSMESANKIRSMLDMAKSSVPVLPEAFDADPFLLGCGNGTIDLRTGKLRSSSRGDLITKEIACEYNKGARAPRWEKFISEVTAGDAELAYYFQRAVGLSLTGDVSEDVLFLLHGQGSNGKSVFLNTLHALLGDYATRTQTETFLLSYGDRHPADLAALAGCRFASTVESPKGRRLNESRLKQLTGRDEISARFMRENFFTFKPTFKLWIACNNLPVIRETGLAVWRRIRLIPFDVTFSGAQVDKHLEETLLDELEGILVWAVEGSVLWQEDGLEPPERIVDATESYKTDSDILSDFFAEKLVKDNAAEIQSGRIYKLYMEFAEDAGDKKPMSTTALGLELAERGYEKIHGMKGNSWRGIGEK